MLLFGIPERQCLAYTGPGSPGMATQETNMEASVSWNVEGLGPCLKDNDCLNFVSKNDFIFCSET